MVYPVDFTFSPDVLENKYWNKIIYWPFKLVVLAIVLFFIWKKLNKEQPFYGLSTKGFSLKPYILMLFIMVPLIAAAATQPDFLYVYPKLMRIEGFLTGENIGFKKLLYELSYGTDFITIELFFRGFLILAFAKWVGKEAILPMALFYCTIHFGKPLGECISSFFGGILLGAITYNTKSIYGGLMVHLGIAWLMELGGYIGHTFY
jgi:membrane protease YdiL (CAAX protease family)